MCFSEQSLFFFEIFFIMAGFLSVCLCFYLMNLLSDEHSRNRLVMAENKVLKRELSESNNNARPL